MIRLLRFLLLALLIQLTLPVFAESPKTDVSATKKSAHLETSELSEAKQQVKLLEAQLQVTRDYQGSLLDTVYWALSGVFIVASLLLGFGWLVNFKIYERDKEALKAELENIARAKGAELDESIAKKMTSINANIDKQIKESIAELMKPHISSISAVERRVFQIEFEHLEEKMKVNPSNNMALTDALRLLELCNKRDHGKVPDIVHFMLKTIDKGGKLTATEITRVNAVLDLLPTHYQTLTEKLRTRLVASDIF